MKRYEEIWRDMEIYLNILIDIERYWLITKQIQMKPEMKYWEMFQDIERYWEIIRYIDRYWEILIDFERYWEMLRDVEGCWEILRDVERYWGILRDIDRKKYTNETWNEIF